MNKMFHSLKLFFHLNLVLVTVLFITSCSTPGKQSGYDRDDWGTSWKVKNCRSVRDRLLINSALKAPVLDKKGCKVKYGVWIDYYTGEKITLSDKPEIDHVVPIKYAHSIGGDRWSKKKKSRFYQDIENLVITSKSLNSSKGAKSFVDWSPASRKISCDYAHRWIIVKTKYSLSFSSAECFNFKALEESKPCPRPLPKINTCG